LLTAEDPKLNRLKLATLFTIAYTFWVKK